MQVKFGTAFAEGIKSNSRRLKISSPQLGMRPTFRLVLFSLILLVSIGGLITRLFELTVIKGNYYRSLSENNRVREQKIGAPRGIIYDRTGKPLVRNIPLADSSGSTREYIYGGLFAHTLGYIGKISPEELKVVNASLPSDRKYDPVDSIGKNGIEQSYESLLRGIDGKRLFEVDAAGEHVRDIGTAPAKEGKSLTLALDLDIQKIASSSMEGKKGAVVVSVPSTGEILALYSSPSFDPNQFIRGDNVQALLSNTQLPLFDRTIGALYPPGSTFKIVTAVAGLESGALTKDTTVEDTGVLQVGQYNYPNWFFLQYGKKEEGLLNLSRALARSNDIYFYKAGEKIGMKTLAQYAKKMGVSKKLGIDIAGEESGLMPDPQWKETVKKEQWYTGDTYHVAIGQGDLLTTPLQVNAWTNVIADSGWLCTPHLIKDLHVRYQQNCQNLKLKPETIEIIREGMKEACSTGGTGWPLFEFKVPKGAVSQSEHIRSDNKNFFDSVESSTSAKNVIKIPIACKTGTAEFGVSNEQTHAWFTAFAPVYDPQITVTVLVEGGGEGSSVAGPIAKKIFEQWFSN